MLAASGRRLDAVICLQADEEELVQRLLRRGLEQGRTDDTEGTIRTRLALYRQQTAPLTDEYRGRGLLAEVDGLGAIDLVTDRIRQALTALTA
jgi:adenylate kinase